MPLSTNPDHQNAARPSEQTEPRRPYSPPRLITHGTVAELTGQGLAGPGVSLPDFAGGG
jgi:hypothetical protein